MGKIVGIDLGTTYSAIATIDETGRPRIVHNREGANITPSCVAEDSQAGGDGVRVGDHAYREFVGGGRRKVAARFKRQMGTDAVQRVGDKEFTPTQLSAFVLKKLAADAEQSIGPIHEAVVTIPANFPQEAREATMAAAKAAGLKVNYIVNEPTAAALYYAFKEGDDLGGLYAVYDLGGGTFDISIIQVNGHDVEVVATNGVSKLGGDDFDQALLKLIQSKYELKTGQRFDEERDFTLGDAEQEKKALSASPSVTTRVLKENIEITRAEFEEAISKDILQAEMLCESAIDEAQISVSDIQQVFLSGGSTRIPAVLGSVRRVFKREPIATVNVDEVVALGAALYAAYKGDQSLLSPIQKKAIEKISVVESTSKCYGIIVLNEANERENSIVISKGAKIPCSVTKSYYTTAEGQVAVNCKITESTAPETDPRFVKLIWEGNLPLPPGRPSNQEIAVTYAYDENQMMKCGFVDVETGKDMDVDLDMKSAGKAEVQDIEKFKVE